MRLRLSSLNNLHTALNTVCFEMLVRTFIEVSVLGQGLVVDCVVEFGGK